MAATEKLFTTFDLAYQLPPTYLRTIAPPAPEASAATTPSVESDEATAQSALWKKI